MSDMDRVKGRVLWFANGIGFICPEGSREGDNDIFFHFTQIIMENDGDYKTLEANDEVEFDIGKNHKGPMAIDITKLHNEDSE